MVFLSKKRFWKQTREPAKSGGQCKLINESEHETLRTNEKKKQDKTMGFTALDTEVPDSKSKRMVQQSDFKVKNQIKEHG